MIAILPALWQTPLCEVAIVTPSARPAPSCQSPQHRQSSLTPGSLEKSLKNREGFTGHILRPAALNRKRMRDSKVGNTHVSAEGVLSNSQRAREKILTITDHHGNVNHNHDEIPPHTHPDAHYRKVRKHYAQVGGGEPGGAVRVAAGSTTWRSCHRRQ